jgi:hypothetical protein
LFAEENFICGSLPGFDCFQRKNLSMAACLGSIACRGKSYLWQPAWVHLLAEEKLVYGSLPGFDCLQRKILSMAARLVSVARIK